MHVRTKLLLTALAVTAVLAAAVGTASARRFELSNQRFRAVWQTQPMIFETHGGGRAICPMTMEGTFHSRTLSKVSGQLIGYITRAAIQSCGTAGGAREIRLLTEMLPWHIMYDSFAGTLPNITRINVNIVGLAFLLNLEGIGSCLYKATAAFPASFEFIRNEVTGELRLLAAETEAQIRKSAGEVFCPAEADLQGSDLVTLLGSTTTKIIVRLVQ
jgi:hypothetical protein